MKNKVIVLDWGIYSHRAIFSAFKNPRASATYIATTMILGNLKKIGVTNNDKIIIACDGRGNWRKYFSKEYKSDRAEKRKKSPIKWEEEYEKMNWLLQTLDQSTVFHVVKLPKIEADDIAAVCCRVFKGSEIVLVSYDEDWQMLWDYSNVSIFSQMTKRYKIKPENFNVYKLLASKIRKEVSDHLTSPILNKAQCDNRMKIVDLLHLPEWVEQSIIAELESLEDKKENLDLIPFKNLRGRFETLYNQDKVVTYEKCIKYEERRANKLKKDKLVKIDMNLTKKQIENLEKKGKELKEEEMRDFETITAESTDLIYPTVPGGTIGIPFEGLNTKRYFIPKNTLEEMKKVKPMLDEELAKLEEEKVRTYKLQDPTKKKILVVRKISPEIVKALGLVAGETSALFVTHLPVKNKETKKYEFGVFGYKSIIVTEK